MASIGRRLFEAAIAIATLPALGQQAGAPVGPVVRLGTVVEKVVPARDGQAPALAPVPPASASSGDELVYTVTFSNVTAQPADQVRITNPLPAGVRYVADTATGPGAEVLYSVDGGATFGAPAELTVVAADGGRRNADTADYTHIRWQLSAPLAAGATGFVRFSAVVR